MQAAIIQHMLQHVQWEELHLHSFTSIPKPITAENKLGSSPLNPDDCILIVVMQSRNSYKHSFISEIDA